MGPLKGGTVDFCDDSPLSPGLLAASCGRLPCETSPDPQLFLRVSNLELFNLQFENEVDPRGQKNKSQTNLSLFFFFRRKEMHLGVFFSDAPAAMVIAPNLCATAAH